MENTKSLSSYFERIEKPPIEEACSSEEDGESVHLSDSETTPPEMPGNAVEPLDSAEQCDANSDACDIDSGMLPSHSSVHVEVMDSSEGVMPVMIDFNNDYPTDRGLFSGDITDADLKRAIIGHGPCKPTSEKYFTNPEGLPNFRESYYHHTDGNIKVPRQWLCYSPTLNRPYCDVCWLFAERKSLINRAWIDGARGDIKNMSSKIHKHEKSDQHILAARTFGRWVAGKTVDKEAEKQKQLSLSFWTKVLHRLVAIILTLCSLNLALRGNREVVGEGFCSGGNFLGLVALVAQFDEVLKEVISLPRRATKYLSPIIQEELIRLLGNAVRKSLIDKINRAPFWAVILDTTSDITRVDQLSVIVRWVHVGEDCFEITESFLGYVEVTDADAKGLVDTTKSYLTGLGLSFTRLRGQGYDGANVMSGVRAGVQKLVKDMCDNPVPFVHCAAHNLNLVINDSVSGIQQNEKFFAIMQEIFNFFGKSLNRWRELAAEAIGGSLTLKKLCTTRWTSRIDSVRALRDRYVHILKVLAKLSLLNKDTAEKSVAIGLQKKMESFEFIAFIVFWERMLRSFNMVSRELQSPKLDLSAACRLLNCVKNELQHLRDNYDSVLETATAIAKSWNIRPVFSHARRYFFGNQRYIQDIDEPKEFFRVNVFYRTIDIALTELRVRYAGQNSVASLFSFLYPQNLKDAALDDIENSTRQLLSSYHRDFSEDLISEIRAFAVEFKDEIAEKRTIQDLLQLLYDYKIISSFPQLHKLFILFLTIPVTVASAERSFSKLKLIKSYLRSRMGQSRLTNLAILSIENIEAKALDVTNLIRQFASVNVVREQVFAK